MEITPPPTENVVQNAWVIDFHGNVVRREEAELSDPILDRLHVDRELALASFDASLAYYGLGGEQDTARRHTTLDTAIADINAVLERDNLDETSSFGEQFLDNELRVALARAIHDRNYDAASIDVRIAAYTEACALLSAARDDLGGAPKKDEKDNTPRPPSLPERIEATRVALNQRDELRTNLVSTCWTLDEQKFALGDVINEYRNYVDANYTSIQHLERRLAETPDDQQIVMRLAQERAYELNNCQVLTDARDRRATISDQIEIIDSYAHSVVGLDYAARIKKFRLDTAEYEKIINTPDADTNKPAFEQSLNDARYFLQKYEDELAEARKQAARIDEMKEPLAPVDAPSATQPRVAA